MTAEEFANVESDIERGRLSNIPECCIQFFVLVWLPLFGSCTLRDKYHAVCKLTGIKYQYVPCPHCVTTKNVQKLYIHQSKRMRVPETPDRLAQCIS